MTPRSILRSAALSLLLGHASLALAQTPPAAPAKPDEKAKPKLKLEDLAPQVRLGVRCELARRQLPVMPVVVIVSDVRSYVAALGRWTTDNRFPVLLDDGTPGSREDVARFVRAFQPRKVVSWTAPAEAQWPEAVDAQQSIVENVVASSWGAKDYADYPARLRFVAANPPGIVVASMKDPAWTAAIALAAGHGEMLAWIDSPDPNVNGQLTMAAADEFAAKLVTACDTTSFDWKGIGDDIDGVTLCLAMPSRVLWQAPPGSEHPKGSLWPVSGEPVATTDLIGRHVRGDRNERWAWAGQIFGSGAEAAYRAMCSLFLQPRRAWIFDGYDSTQPWSLFDGTETASLLKKANLNSELDDAPKQGLADWRDRTAGSWRPRSGQIADKDRKPVGCIDAGLICVNTSGMAESFDLKPGQALSGDIPFLDRPAIVNFVHSWSAQAPRSKATIAGRWLDRGAYAYVGSVHEPFLSAFQPTPMFVKRLIAPATLGIAARHDGAPPWRIALFGDPLITVGPPGAESKADFPLDDAAELRDALRPLLAAGNYESSFANLIMSGRDVEVVRLAKAALKQEPEKVTSAALRLALPAVMRRADAEGATAILTRLADDPGTDYLIQDLAWHTLGASATSLTMEQVLLLGRMLRDGSFVRDAEEVSGMLRRLGGESARRKWLESLMGTTKDAGRRAALDKILVAPK